MKFYKLIKNNEFLNVASSNNFYEYNPINHTFLLSNEIYGEFVDLNGHLYRDYWMREVPDDSLVYETIDIEEISQEIYDTIIEAMINHEEIIPDIIPEEPEDQQLTPISNDITEDIDYLKRIVIARLSSECNQAIEAGFDLQIHGETQHFSLTIQDQINLMNLGTMAATESLIPYHADGEDVTFYTNVEINQIIDAANSFKIYHTTYYNALKAYVNSLETAEEVIAIQYGDEIPEEYKTDVLKILEQ